MNVAQNNINYHGGNMNRAAIKEQQEKIESLTMDAISSKNRTQEETDAKWEMVYAAQRDLKALVSEGKSTFNREAYINLQTEGYGY
jgi:hypothetical protein